MPSLKTSLASGKLLRVFALGQLCSPKLVEIVAYQGGFDAIWLDQEHAGLSTAQIEEAARAGRAAGIATFVRLPATDYAAVMRVLEAGCSGFMASMVRSVEEVRQIVHWARFRPIGGRGINGTGFDGRFGTLPLSEYFAYAEQNTAVGIQIEHADALAVVESISEVPGVDFLFIGPADLSQTLGITGQWDHPKLWEGIERVARACQKASIPWGILPFGPDFARRCVNLGCRMLSLGIDVWAFQRGVQNFQEQYREFFPTPAEASPQ